MGSVAGHALFGPDFRVGDLRGRVGELPDRPIWSAVTIHPSAALRADDRAAAFDGLVADLRLAAERLAG
jgi:DNA polymerase